MREHEAGRPRMPGRWRSWIKRISNVATHVSAASLLATGMASSLAARKDKSRNNDPGGKDHTDRNRDGHGSERNREAKHADDPREDRRVQREHRDSLHGDGEGRHGHHSGKQEPQNDESSDVHSAARQNNPTPTPTPTEAPRGDGGGGGGGGGGDGGDGGDGGGGGGSGHRAGNAGSGLFDSPLATKARRRANDFDNAGHDNEHDGTLVDVHPQGESVYETNSVAFTTGPDGLEIHTGNITYFAEATPAPEPLPRLELPVHEPGFPFGENFPFGNLAAADRPVASEPADPGDTGTDLTTRAKPIFDSGLSETDNSDGGDNTMDFTS
jgi:hypothetical protein